MEVEKRMCGTMPKLKSLDMVRKYEKILKAPIGEGIVEVVLEEE